MLPMCVFVCMCLYVSHYILGLPLGLSLLFTVSAPPSLIIALQNMLISSPPNDACVPVVLSSFHLLMFPGEFLNHFIVVPT